MRVEVKAAGARLIGDQRERGLDVSAAVSSADPSSVSLKASALVARSHEP
jgi:hypothetical protein